MIAHHAKEHLVVSSLSVVVLLTILAQFPNSPLDPLSMAAWAAILVLILLTTFSSVRVSGYFVLFLCCIAGTFCASAVASVVFGMPAFSPLLIVIGKAFIVYAVGSLLPVAGVSSTGISRVLIVYVVAAALLALQIRVAYFSNLDAWFAQLAYAYGSKNSVGPIVAIAVMVLLLSLASANRMISTFRVVCAAILTGFLFLLQSRAAIVALAAALLVHLALDRRSRYALLPIAAVMVVAHQIPLVRAVIDQAFLISRYAGGGVDAFSSGRITWWLSALDVVKEHLWVGTGAYYVDNFYINVMANFGLIGAAFVFIVWLQRIVRNIHVIPRAEQVERRLAVTLRTVTVFYIVLSFAEGYPPFGPGASSLVFWLLCGYCDGVIRCRGADASVRVSQAHLCTAAASSTAPVYADPERAERGRAAVRS